MRQFPELFSTDPCAPMGHLRIIMLRLKTLWSIFLMLLQIFHISKGFPLWPGDKSQKLSYYLHQMKNLTLITVCTLVLTHSGLTQYDPSKIHPKALEAYEKGLEKA